MLSQIISDRARKIVYAVYALAGVVLGSVYVAYQSTPAEQPEWLTVAVAVFAYLGTAFGALAGGNVPSVPGLPASDTPSPDDELGA